MSTAIAVEHAIPKEATMVDDTADYTKDLKTAYLGNLAAGGVIDAAATEAATNFDIAVASLEKIDDLSEEAIALRCAIANYDAYNAAAIKATGTFDAAFEALSANVDNVDRKSFSTVIACIKADFSDNIYGMKAISTFEVLTSEVGNKEKAMAYIILTTFDDVGYTNGYIGYDPYVAAVANAYDADGWAFNDACCAARKLKATVSAYNATLHDS